MFRQNTLDEHRFHQFVKFRSPRGHASSGERAEHLLVNADGSLLSPDYLRKHFVARDRVCAGNARIQIGRHPRENSLVAGRHPEVIGCPAAGPRRCKTASRDAGLNSRSSPSKKSKGASDASEMRSSGASARCGRAAIKLVDNAASTRELVFWLDPHPDQYAVTIGLVRGCGTRAPWGRKRP